MGGGRLALACGLGQKQELTKGAVGQALKMQETAPPPPVASAALATPSELDAWQKSTLRQSPQSAAPGGLSTMMLVLAMLLAASAAYMAYTYAEEEPPPPPSPPANPILKFLKLEK